MQVRDSDSRKEGIIVGDVKFVKEYEHKGKEGVMTKNNNAIDRNKKDFLEVLNLGSYNYDFGFSHFESEPLGMPVFGWRFYRYRAKVKTEIIRYL